MGHEPYPISVDAIYGKSINAVGKASFYGKPGTAGSGHDDV
jgi:hypothetical protein